MYQVRVNFVIAAYKPVFLTLFSYQHRCQCYSLYSVRNSPCYADLKDTVSLLKWGKMKEKNKKDLGTAEKSLIPNSSCRSDLQETVSLLQWGQNESKLK